MTKRKKKRRASPYLTARTGRIRKNFHRLREIFFVHNALPEIALQDVDLSIDLFGKKLKSAGKISSMVGGIPEAARINHNRARAAQSLGLAMGVGSQTVA